ncbi:N-acetylmuramoyl-L-alanine amidase CwlD [Clostridium sp. KNHs214]|uniref:N-acetylmuramoyl-L-alanine amidase CwlD n=1 Tax=Clostridium sp. KNHs214 TaxID=1540257 RepID=UPI0009DD630D|nr:N-acetylmuramoyl-L-alanine amidase CwlD [Clostridium sp. KNHs214]
MRAVKEAKIVKNNKLISTIGVIVVGAFLIVLTNIQFGKTLIVNKDLEKRTILIDPGHGGIDGGAVSKNGTVEKHINLNISLNLKEELKKKGYKVIMTREEDKGLYSEDSRSKKIEDLNNRCEIKEKTKCDMFISIHLNKFPQSKYYGAQVWHSSNPESKELADIIQKKLIEDLDKQNKRQPKDAKDMYKILRCNDTIPSVIVECGFLSNEREEQLLKDEAYQEKIAKSISKSVDEYFNFKKE